MITVMDVIKAPQSGLYDLSVVGESHHISEIRKYIADDHEAVTGETAVTAFLVREPNNPYDKNAVKVMFSGTDQAGYLDRNNAQKLAYYWNKKIVLETSAKIIGHSGMYGLTIDLDQEQTIALLKAELKKDTWKPIAAVALIVVVYIVFLLISMSK